MAADSDALFGQIAARAGLLTPQQIQEITREQATASQAGRQIDLGEICQLRRLLTSAQVQWVLSMTSRFAEPTRREPDPSAADPPRALPSETTGLLVEVREGGGGRIYRLPWRARIGRQDSNEVPVADVDCSRQHAVVGFDLETGRHTLFDLNSTNGTFVNEERVVESRLLEPGDRIRIGRVSFRYSRDVGSIENAPQSDDASTPAMASQLLEDTGLLPAVEPEAGNNSPPTGRLEQHRFVYRPHPAYQSPLKNPRAGGKLICPHCWYEFPPERTLFLARHRDLVGDPVLGAEAPQRFLPSRFTPVGNAIDPMGMECPDRACPRCHLKIPRGLYDAAPLFLSIVGAPASGKSYYLTSLVWELRRLLPGEFHLIFGDADAETNQWLNSYEETLFLNSDPDRPVYLRKTEMQGEIYEPVMLDGMPVLLPRPSIFSIRPQERHARVRKGRKDLARNIVLYDNAGEHFQPGMDSAGNPGTQHLLHSQAILFLFDPTRDPRFAKRCGLTEHAGEGRKERQDVLLTELIGRISRHRGLSAGEKTDLPLLVVVTKFDVWRHLVSIDLATPPLRKSKVLLRFECRVAG